MSEHKTTHRGRESRRDLYLEVTSKILEEMEQGVLPWRRPWDLGNVVGGANQLPQNAISQRPYNGINRLMLMMSPMALDGDPRWCTYHQAQERDWQVRKGSKGTPVFFYKMIELKGAKGHKNDDDPDITDGKTEAMNWLKGSGGGWDGDGQDEVRRIPILRSYTVFHASQIEGIPAFEPAPRPEREQNWTPIDHAEELIKASGARIVTGGDRACYNPALDCIAMPPREAFHSAEGFYATQLHELGHWTGHESRLARTFGAKGSAQYAREELVAELASVFMGLETGIEPQMHEAASYLDSWVNALKEDKKVIFRAAADAHRATEHVLRLAGMAPDMEFDADGIAFPEIDVEASTAAVPARRARP